MPDPLHCCSCRCPSCNQCTVSHGSYTVTISGSSIACETGTASCDGSYVVDWNGFGCAWSLDNIFIPPCFLFDVSLGLTITKSGGKCYANWSVSLQSHFGYSPYGLYYADPVEIVGNTIDCSSIPPLTNYLGDPFWRDQDLGISVSP